MTRFAWILAIGLVACGDDAKKSSSSPNNSNNTTPNNTTSNNTASNNGNVVDVTKELWSMLCDATFECPNPDLVAFIGRYPSAAACKAGTPPAFMDFPGFNEAIARGTVTYNSSKAQACLDKWSEQFCDLSFVVPPVECDEVTIGKQNVGDVCYDSVECAPGLQCETSGNACAGTCQPNCGEFSCTNDEFCSETGCVALAASGQPCNDFDECARGLFCIEGTCTNGKSVAAGGDCQLNGECVEGLVCVQGVCSDVGFAARGAACSLGQESNFCQPGVVCTNLTLGDNELVGTCGNPKSAGGTCRVFYECEIGLTCDSADFLTEGKCVPVKENGQPCSTQFDCASGFCEDDVCVAPTMCE